MDDTMLGFEKDTLILLAGRVSAEKGESQVIIIFP